MRKKGISVLRLLGMAAASLCIYSCIAVKGEAAETGRYIAEDVLSPEVETEITERIASMSLHEKVCQMIVCYPSQLAGVKNVTEMNDTMEQMLELLPVGGVILDKTNMKKALEWVRDMSRKPECCGIYAAHDPEVKPGSYEF